MYWTLELASKLEDAPWPATKDELIDFAIRSGAPLEVIENLQEIEDEGEVYESIEDIWPDYPTDGDFFVGIGFAVPINVARDVMSQIIQHGRVIRGYLGVGTQPVRIPASQRAGRAQDQGRCSSASGRKISRACAREASSRSRRPLSSSSPYYRAAA